MLHFEKFEMKVESTSLPTTNLANLKGARLPQTLIRAIENTLDDLDDRSSFKLAFHAEKQPV
jgi:hypothetical protein